MSIPPRGSSYQLLGEIEIDAGRLPDARNAANQALNVAREALNIARRLAERESDNPVRQRELHVAQRDLAYSDRLLGDIAVRSGDVKLARKAYTEAKEIAERLVKEDPGNSQLQRQLWERACQGIADLDHQESKCDLDRKG